MDSNMLCIIHEHVRSHSARGSGLHSLGTASFGAPHSSSARRCAHSARSCFRDVILVERARSSWLPLRQIDSVEGKGREGKSLLVRTRSITLLVRSFTGRRQDRDSALDAATPGRPTNSMTALRRRGGVPALDDALHILQRGTVLKPGFAV